MSRGIKFSGIQFRKDDESGIAKITIENTTQSTYVIQDALVDLYAADMDATNGEYEPFVYWTTLDPAEDSYTVTAVHSGTHNENALSPYDVKIDGYLLNEELEDGEVEATIHLWHTDHPSDITQQVLPPNGTLDTYKTVTFNGDGSTTEFSLISGAQRAFDAEEFSVDGGTTWLYPGDPDLSWGSNAPTYDDNIMESSTGYFTVKFDTAPASGTNNVQIKFIPLYNKFKVVTKIKQPSDGVVYTDLKHNVRLLDHAVEAIG